MTGDPILPDRLIGSEVDSSAKPKLSGSGSGGIWVTPEEEDDDEEETGSIRS